MGGGWERENIELTSHSDAASISDHHMQCFLRKNRYIVILSFTFCFFQLCMVSSSDSMIYKCIPVCNICTDETGYGDRRSTQT